MPPVVSGCVSGTTALPSNALTIGAPSRSALRSSSSRAPSAPAPASIAGRRAALSSSAAWATVSGGGTRTLGVAASDTWWAMLRVEGAARSTDSSCTSVGIARWLTPRFASAARQARAVAFSMWAALITRLE